MDGLGGRLLRNVGRWYAIPGIVMVGLAVVLIGLWAVTGDDSFEPAAVGGGATYGLIFLTLWLPVLVVSLLLIEVAALWLPVPVVRALGIVAILAIAAGNLVMSTFLDNEDIALVAVLAALGIIYVCLIEISSPRSKASD